MKNDLKVMDITKEYRQGNAILHVLKGITVSFAQGMSYAITGSSGCGKSTFMHLLAGIDAPTTGHVYYNDHDIESFIVPQKNFFLNHTIGLVFQYSYLIKELTVQENVMLKGLIGGMPQEECRQKAEQLLHELGLGDKKFFKPGTLSGGQQQRVAIARALINKPTFLLADEPTGNLDEKTGLELVNLLLKLQKEWDLGLIISSHDEYVTNHMQQVYELQQGKLTQKR